MLSRIGITAFALSLLPLTLFAQPPMSVDPVGIPSVGSGMTNSTPAIGPNSGQFATPQSPALVAQQYNVLLFQQSLMFSGAFAFDTSGTPQGTNALANMDGSGMNSGPFAADLGGMIFAGQYASLDFGGASVWIAQGSSGSGMLTAMGWKTDQELVGQASLSLGGEMLMPGLTFFVVGQSAVQSSAFGLPGTANSGGSANVPTTPAPSTDARPSPSLDARPSSIFGSP